MLLCSNLSFAASVKKEALLKNIGSYIVHHAPHKKVKKISLSKSVLSVPCSEPQHRIRIRNATRKHLYVAYFLQCPSGESQKLEATVMVDTMVKRLVAVRTVAKETRLKKSDLEERSFIDTGSTEYLRSIDEAVGKFAAQKLRKGKAIKYYQLHPEYLIRKRHNVKMVYDAGAVHIEMMGMALQNGTQGEEVKVKNISSGKVLNCKVSATNTVECAR